MRDLVFMLCLSLVLVCGFVWLNVAVAALVTRNIALYVAPLLGAAFFGFVAWRLERRAA